VRSSFDLLSFVWDAARRRVRRGNTKDNTSNGPQPLSPQRSPPPENRALSASFQANPVARWTRPADPDVVDTTRVTPIVFKVDHYKGVSLPR